MVDTETLPALPRDGRLAQRAFYPWWVTERVRWSDTDSIGHVNNVAFATYAEYGRTEFLREWVDRPAGSRVMLLLAQMNLSFLGEAHWPADVDIGARVLALGRSSCRLGHGLFIGERCFATVDTLLVHIDESTRQPCEIPADARAYLARFAGAPPAER